MRGKVRKYRRPLRFRKRLQPTHRILLRQRRRHLSILKNRFFWDFVLFLIFGCLIFYFIFLSPVFKIKEIRIAGPKNIPYHEIRTLLDKKLQLSFLYFFQKNSFFLINSKKIESEILNKYPEIKEVNLKKKFPKTLILEVKKRQPVGVWCLAENECFLIDKEGIIFQSANLESGKQANLIPIFSENYEIKKLGEKIISEEKMSQILKIKDTLKEKMKINIEKFTLKSPERLNVKTTEGWEIYFDLSTDINLALTKLRLLFEKEIPPEIRKTLHYIDLRFSKVYYK
jgi:cell division septal protein FtsQ